MNPNGGLTTDQQSGRTPRMAQKAADVEQLTQLVIGLSSVVKSAAGEVVRVKLETVFEHFKVIIFTRLKSLQQLLALPIVILLNRRKW